MTGTRIIEDWDAVTRREGDCLVWTKARNSDGYGSLGRNGKTIGAHRAAYSDLVGPIPEGLSVLHHCDNPPCVNPEHLFLGTQKDNVHDALEKKRHRNVRRRTVCSRGHRVEGDNAYWYRGYAQCRACKNLLWRNLYYRKKKLREEQSVS